MFKDLIPFNFFYSYIDLDLKGFAANYTISNTAAGFGNLRCSFGYYSSTGIKGISTEDYRVYSDNE